MPSCRYHIVNVYSESPLSGLPVAVFDQAPALDESTMLALAQQVQTALSVFLLPSARGHARLAIFTPERSQAFSPDALFAAATVLRERRGEAFLTLEIAVMIAPLWLEQERWFYQVQVPLQRELNVRQRHLAAMLNLNDRDLDEPPLFIDAGDEWLVLPLTHPDAVKDCVPKLEDMSLHAVNSHGLPQLLVWHRSMDSVMARSFVQRFGSLREEPASGAAIAALAGYLLNTRAPLPISLRVRQGDYLERPARMALQIDDNRRILLGGQTRIQSSVELNW